MSDDPKWREGYNQGVKEALDKMVNEVNFARLAPHEHDSYYDALNRAIRNVRNHLVQR